MKDDVIVDIETLSIRSNAVVLSIGAVRFNREDVGTTIDTIHVGLDEAEQAEKRHRDPNTIQWWMQQSDAAKTSLFEDLPKHSVVEALEAFNAFANGAGFLWGNGSSFDNVILRSLAEDFGIKSPIPYYNDRDLRTLIDLANWDKNDNPVFEGIKHHALDDAIHEHRIFTAAYKKLNG